MHRALNARVSCWLSYWRILSGVIFSAKFVKEPCTLYGHMEMYTCSIFVPVLTLDILCLSLHLADLKTFQI